MSRFQWAQSSSHTRRPPKWHRICFALTAFVFLTIGISAWAIHYLADKYAEAIDTNQVWTDRMGLFSGLSNLAGRVNNSGNAIFETEDPTQAAELVRKDSSAFQKAWRDVRADLEEHVGSPQSTTLLAELDLAGASMDQMILEANTIIDLLRAGRRREAGIRMATMDRYLYEVQEAMNRTDGEVHRILSAQLRDQGERVGLFKIVQTIIESLIVILVLGIALYGRRVSRLAMEHREDMESIIDRLHVQGAALEAAANAIVITSRDGTIEWVNPAFSHSTGYAYDETIGNDPSILNSGRHDRKFYDDLWETVQSGRTWQGEMINRRKDGSEYPEEMTITPVRDIRGEISHFIAIKHDITERKNREEILRRSEISLRESEEKLILQNVELQKSLNIQAVSNHELEKEIEERKVVEEELEGQAMTLIRAKEMLAEQTANLSDHNEELRKLRKSAERAAQISTEKEERIRAIVNATSNGIVSIDESGIIVSVNPALCGLFCYGDDEILGQNIKMLMPSPLRKKHEASFNRYQSGGESHILGKVIEVSGLTKSGRTFPLELVVNELSFNKRRMFVGVLNDITDRKQAEEAEREARGLQEAVKSMEQVLGVIGHELRTPLAAVRMTSEFLLNSEPGESEASGPFVKSIHDETVRMAEMVNNMLEVSRMNSGCAQWNWDTVNLATVCGEAINTIRPFVNVEAVELKIEMAPELNMRGDPDAIRRLILNLLSNAAKHTEAGSIVVSARGFDDDGVRWVHLEVRDSGEGIPPEIAKKLGEPFALNSGLVGSEHIKGTGLGLAICKGIVAAHGGTLAVESSEGEGSSFMVSLRSDLPQAETVTGSIDIKGRVAA